MALGRIAYLGVALPLVAYAAEAWGKAQALCNPVPDGQWVRAVVMKAKGKVDPGDGDLNFLLRPVGGPGSPDDHLTAFKHVPTVDLLETMWDPTCASDQARVWRKLVRERIVRINDQRKWGAACNTYMGNGSEICEPPRPDELLSLQCRKLFSSRDCMWDIDKHKGGDLGIATFALEGEVYFGNTGNQWSGAIQDGAKKLGIDCKNKDHCKCYEYTKSQGWIGRGSESICGKEVLIRGMRARDESHAGRPEIHPVSTIVIAHDPPSADGTTTTGVYRAGFFVDGSEDTWEGDFAEALGRCSKGVASCVDACMIGVRHKVTNKLLGWAGPVGGFLSTLYSFGVCAGVGINSALVLAMLNWFGEDFGESPDTQIIDFTANYQSMGVYSGQINPNMQLTLANVIAPAPGARPLSGGTVQYEMKYRPREWFLFPKNKFAPTTETTPTSPGLRPNTRLVVKLPVGRKGAAAIHEFTAGWNPVSFYVDARALRRNNVIAPLAAPPFNRHDGACSAIEGRPGQKMTRWHRFKVHGSTTMPASFFRDARWTWRFDGDQEYSRLDPAPGSSPPSSRCTRYPSYSCLFEFSAWVAVPEGGMLEKKGYERTLTVTMTAPGGWRATDKVVLRVPEPPSVEIQPGPIRRFEALVGSTSQPRPGAAENRSFGPILTPGLPRLKPAYDLTLGGTATGSCTQRNDDLVAAWSVDGSAVSWDRGLPTIPLRIWSGETKTVDLVAYDRWGAEGDVDAVVLEPPMLVLQADSRCLSAITVPMEIMGRGGPREDVPFCTVVEFTARGEETLGQGADFPRITPTMTRFEWPRDQIKMAAPAGAVTYDIQAMMTPHNLSVVPRDAVTISSTTPNRIRVDVSRFLDPKRRTPLPLPRIDAIYATVKGTDSFGRLAVGTFGMPLTAYLPPNALSKLEKELKNLGKRRGPPIGAPAPTAPGSVICSPGICDPADPFIVRTLRALEIAARKGGAARRQEIILARAFSYIQRKKAVKGCEDDFSASYKGPTAERLTAMERACDGRINPRPLRSSGLLPAGTGTVSRPQKYRDIKWEARQKALWDARANPPRLSPSKLPPPGAAPRPNAPPRDRR